MRDPRLKSVHELLVLLGLKNPSCLEENGSWADRETRFVKQDVRASLFIEFALCV